MQKQKVSFGELTGWKNYGKVRPLVHILFWVLYIFTYAYIYSLFYKGTTLPKALLQYTVSGWIDVAAAYTLVYLFIPRLLLRKKYLLFVIIFFITAVVTIFLQRVMLFKVTMPYLYPDVDVSYKFFRFNYLYSFFNIWVMPAIFASVKLFEYWYVNQKQNQELMKEKLESELKFLKSQIHPHFLFNTLNNLYALTLDKSDKAPEVVVKLSDLLSYMLYECNVPRVPLEKEINLLKDYLDLEKIRYQSELKIDFDVQGRINGKMIAPLLLIPFVENGFKHGLSKQIEKPWINIYMEIEDLSLTFRVENNKPGTGQADETGYTEGIGLKNVRRRLDLIYGENYKLDVENAGDIFSITLHIKLDNLKKEIRESSSPDME